jgi:hypothetical protein
MMEAIRSTETSILTRATRRKIPEGGILQSNYKFCWPFLLDQPLNLTLTVLHIPTNVGESSPLTWRLIVKSNTWIPPRSN